MPLGCTLREEVKDLDRETELVISHEVQYHHWVPLSALVDPDRQSELRWSDGGLERVFPTIDAYLRIAAQHDLEPSQMAIAWTMTRPFPMIPIIGATSPEQLGTVLGAGEVTLSDDVLAEISAVHRAHPLPY